ncbi:hypothetical protein, partial [Xanthomonas translucens]
MTQPHRRPRSAPRARFPARLGLLMALGVPLLGQAAVPATLSLQQGWQVRLAPGEAHAKDFPKAAQWL